MKTTADISWPGGKAKHGDVVDPTSVPPMILARWQDGGVLVEDADYSDDLVPDGSLTMSEQDDEVTL